MKDKAPLHGMIVLDKPTGIGSNRVMSRLKRLLGVSKIGFLGTLDPLATGVLPVFIGKATKIIPAFEKLDKSYRVTFSLGQRTDTLDSEGTVLETLPTGHLTPEAVKAAILSFEGEMEQTVPEYSAVKIKGVPAYRLAREGKAVPIRTRRVRLEEIVVEAVELPSATFQVTCGAGTYMRSLVEDIGQLLGVGAHMTALRRIRCGCLFTLENSIKLMGIEENVAKGDFDFLKDPSEFLPEFLPMTVEPMLEGRLKNGQPIPLSVEFEQPLPLAKIKALQLDGRLVAIGEAVGASRESMMFQPKKVLI